MNPEDVPLVSVVMPTLNGRTHIEAAIRSLQSQDCPSLEIIVVDDGSTDDTPGIVERMRVEDGRIMLHHAGSRSIARARNAGIAAAAGRYIAFLDHDDICPPRKIARQLAFLAPRPDVLALFGRTVFFASLDGPDPEEALPQGGPLLTIALGAALFRREAFTKVGPLDPRYRLADDFDFVLRLIEGGHSVAVEEATALLHRRHAGQATSDIAATKREMALALAASLRRRREAGLPPRLAHLLTEGLRP